VNDVNDPPLRDDLPGGAHVLFTTREEGNMSSVRGARAAQGHLTRERLRRGIAVDGLARGRQVHGGTVAWSLGHDSPAPFSPDRSPEGAHGADGADGAGAARPLDEADGQVTPLRGLGVMVLTADCLPVAVATPGAVAMLHAGWRGLAAGILEEGVLALRELAGEQPMQAVIGPGAGPCCYEVGEEVHRELGAEARRGPIDLAAIAERRLRAAGVEEVRSVGLCTICDARFFSHRREGDRAGRQAGVAWRS
jgi:YfiH family protein